MKPDADRTTVPTKTCRSCGRRITWRRKWSGHWHDIRYCSTRCRCTRPNATDRKLEKEILGLLSERARGASICPSEAARRVADGDDWRQRMAATRQAARRLVAEGRVEIVQRGRVVDPSTAKGPIRIRAVSV